MELPKQVKVGGLIYEILAQPDLMRETDHIGTTKHANLLVTVDATVPLQVQQSTLLHELLHCISNVYLNPDNLTEEQAYHLEGGLFQVLRDNSEVTAFILGGMNGSQ